MAEHGNSINSHININGGNNRHIVLSLLGNLVTVVVSIATIAMSMSTSRFADSYHLNISLLFVGDINSTGSSVFNCLLIIVTANFLWNNFNTFCADSAFNIVGKSNIFDYFDG